MMRRLALLLALAIAAPAAAQPVGGPTQQQLNRDWYYGVRLDWTKDALDDSREVWGLSPYVSWYWSEFLRFRLEYQHKEGDTADENTLYLQITWIFGAHPPHPYLAMR